MREAMKVAIIGAETIGFSSQEHRRQHPRVSFPCWFGRFAKASAEITTGDD
jgi:hypothetical protein